MSCLVLIKSVTFLMKICHQVVKKCKIVSRTREWVRRLCVGQGFFSINFFMIVNLFESPIERNENQCDGQ